MAGNNSRLVFLQGRHTRLVTLLLLGEAALFHLLPVAETVHLSRPFRDFPTVVNGWTMVQEAAIEPEVQDLLKADESMDRYYRDASGHTVNLFVAFFKSQRAGVSPHSPKVCLPGSGWTPTETRTARLTVPGWPEPIEVNRYIVAKGNEKKLVLYWYQSYNRVVASEYAAKLYLMLDGIRYRRSDASLVRVIVPLAEGQHAAADQIAVEFIRSFFGPVRQFLPS